jgi:hypothetical protein
MVFFPHYVETGFLALETLLPRAMLPNLEAHGPPESSDKTCNAWNFTSTSPNLLRGELHRQKGTLPPRHMSR